MLVLDAGAPYSPQEADSSSNLSGRPGGWSEQPRIGSLAGACGREKSSAALPRVDERLSLTNPAMQQMPDRPNRLHVTARSRIPQQLDHDAMQLIVRQLGDDESHVTEVGFEIAVRYCAGATRISGEKRIGAVDGEAERGLELLSLFVGGG